MSKKNIIKTLSVPPVSGALEQQGAGVCESQPPAYVSLLSSSTGVALTDREAGASGMGEGSRNPKSGMAWMGEGTEP